MEELAPGLYDWTARHEGHGQIVHSHYLADGGVVIDPMGPPPDGLPGEPRLVVLTSRHHLRHAANYGVPIVAHEAGLHEFDGGDVDVAPFAFGDELSPGVRALEVGVLTPEETALHLDTGDGWLVLADAVTRGQRRRAELRARRPDRRRPRGRQGGPEGRAAADPRQPRTFAGLLLAHGAPGTRAELEAFVA